jgi:hypothetical protein
MPIRVKSKQRIELFEWKTDRRKRKGRALDLCQIKQLNFFRSKTKNPSFTNLLEVVRFKKN